MSTTINREVGRRIATARGRYGVTQAALARAMRDAGWQIDSTAVTRIESGERDVRISQLSLIANALGMGVTDLIPGETGDRYEAGYRDGLTDARGALDALAATRADDSGPTDDERARGIRGI